MKEKVTFSDMVSKPILSFGRLMRSGWSIDGQIQCLCNGSLEVPLSFQNQSLVVDASIRVIAEPMLVPPRLAGDYAGLGTDGQVAAKMKLDFVSAFGELDELV